MILVVCTDDPKLVKIANDSQALHGGTFGAVRQAFGAELPKLGVNENLFIIAHGAYKGDGNNPVIGDKRAALYVNAVDLYKNIRGIFPPGYAGNVYIDACESADHEDHTHSFIEVFFTQVQPYQGRTAVFGRAGAAGGLIPLPGDTGWQQAA